MLRWRTAFPVGECATEDVLQLSHELPKVDALMDDERFLAPSGRGSLAGEEGALRRWSLQKSVRVI